MNINQNKALTYCASYIRHSFLKSQLLLRKKNKLESQSRVKAEFIKCKAKLLALVDLQLLTAGCSLAMF